MGHARTANARIRSRQAWSEITTALNSDGTGCTKTAQQWCKYWKDKKAAVKRKSRLIAAARRRTGGGIEDVPELSKIEVKIQKIMRGESFDCDQNPSEEEPLDRTVESEVSQRFTSPTQRVHIETRGRRRTQQPSPRQSAARRRLLRRNSPPSQRRSEMVSITERFIAIEERRAEAELLIAQAISRQVEGHQAMAQALDRISSAIRDLINK